MVHIKKKVLKKIVMLLFMLLGMHLAQYYSHQAPTDISSTGLKVVAEPTLVVLIIARHTLAQTIRDL